MSDTSDIAEAGRAIVTAARLGARPASPGHEKFELGDLVASLSDEQVILVAKEIGLGLSGSKLISYRNIANAWPVETRVAASWTTHRTLATSDKRFDLIQPGMTLREAQVTLGKTPADTEHPSRWPLERRVPFVVNQLLDAGTSQAIKDEMDGRKKTRAARAAVRMVEEDKSAEYKDALRRLREARDAKHPERAAYDALFKIREAQEYVRAVAKASSDEASFLPHHMRPDLITAIRDLATSAISAVSSLAPEESSARQALADIAATTAAATPREVSGFTIIQGEVLIDDADAGRSH